MNKKFVSFSHSSYTATQNIKIEIPVLCPYCQVSNNPINTFLNFLNKDEKNFLLLMHTCTSCKKSSFSLQTVENKTATVQSEYPLSITKIFNPLLEKL